jgi:L-erythro-3,5-diaminohexanoate dehydrogenase
MTTDSMAETAQRLGADRVIDPPGELPQPAERLDPSGPVRPYEFEVRVERLCLDSTSFRNIRERARGDTGLMGNRIIEIVESRGKMHNPETESGGVLLGTVTAVGERVADPPAVGERIVTLGSLTLTALRLEAVTEIDPGSPQVGVEGTAYVFDRASWAPLPDDLSAAAALELYDVCGAATQTKALAPAEGSVCVLGAGHGGKLVLAAARDAMEDGTLVAVDVDPAAIERVTGLGLCDIGVTADLRKPLEAASALRAAGAPPADLTVVVVNATGCEPTAILLTAEDGTVLFFSMATHFSNAALASDGLGTNVRMLVGSGYAPDRGAYALELLRRSAPLQRAMGVSIGESHRREPLMPTEEGKQG